VLKVPHINEAIEKMATGHVSPATVWWFKESDKSFVVTQDEPQSLFLGGPMAASDQPRRPAPRWKASRDWPLAGTALSAFISFVMLFPPWLTGEGGSSENAFGSHLQATGPALIIVMSLAVLFLVGVAAATTNRRYVVAASVPSAILLAIYLVKVGDVSDLADLYNQAAASFTSARVSTGAALWVGLVFSFLTVLFLLLALGLKWGVGEALVYPVGVVPPGDGKPSTPTDYPPPPGDLPPHGPASSAQEHPDR
jgi:hypothetical protein